MLGDRSGPSSRKPFTRDRLLDAPPERNSWQDAPRHRDRHLRGRDLREEARIQDPMSARRILVVLFGGLAIAASTATAANADTDLARAQMLAINTNLALRGTDYRLEAIEGFTIGSGRFAEVRL